MVAWSSALMLVVATLMIRRSLRAGSGQDYGAPERT